MNFRKIDTIDQFFVLAPGKFDNYNHFLSDFNEILYAQTLTIRTSAIV